MNTKRAAAAVVSAAVLSGGMITAIAEPANAKPLKMEKARISWCTTDDKYCGGMLWVHLPWKYVPNEEANSWAWGTLRNSKGKKVKMDIFRATGDQDWESGSTELNNATLYNWRGDLEGPMWYLPTRMKKGTYTLTWKVKQAGIWDCSIHYQQVCEWDKGFTISKKVKFKYKPMPPVEWYAPGTEPGLDEDY